MAKETMTELFQTLSQRYAPIVATSSGPVYTYVTGIGRAGTEIPIVTVRQ